MTQSAVLDDDEIDLGQLVVTLWKGKVLIALTTALGIAAGAFFIANTNPTFQADALLQLEEKNRLSGAAEQPERDGGQRRPAQRDRDRDFALAHGSRASRRGPEPGLARFAGQWPPVIGTMLSRYRFSVIDTVIPDHFIRPGERIALDHLVVPPAWLNREIELVVLSDQSYRLALPDGLQIDGAVGQQATLAETGFSLTLASIEAPLGRRFTIQQVDEIRAIDSLRRRLGISERGRASGILDIRVSGRGSYWKCTGAKRDHPGISTSERCPQRCRGRKQPRFIREQLPQARTQPSRGRGRAECLSPAAGLC